MEQIKELRSDGKDPLFDKSNMLFKEFPSDFRQIRYFTLLIVQSAPLEIKEINLLEQQISEVNKDPVLPEIINELKILKKNKKIQIMLLL